MEESPRTVQVELVPLNRATVQETPSPSLGRLMIPVSMGPRDLDGLLGRSGLIYRIQGRRLRESIGECLRALDLSLENLTIIEWEEPPRLPEADQEVLEEADWIRTVDISPRDGILTGSYDGSIRWYGLPQGEQPSSPLQGAFKYGLATRSTVTVVRWLPMDQPDSCSRPPLVLAGMSDGSIHLWSLSLSSSVALEGASPTTLLTGHTSAIQAIHVAMVEPSVYLVYTADYEGLICKYCLNVTSPSLMGVTMVTVSSAAGKLDASAKRKRRAGSKAVVPPAALPILQPVVCLRLASTVATILPASTSLLLVAAWDGNVYRVASDTLTLDSKESVLMTTDPISCATINDDGSLLVTGHSNGSIRSWDPVNGERRALHREAHIGWVAGVRLLKDASGKRSFLASAGYDGRVHWWEPSDISKACDSLVDQGGKKILALASHGHIFCTGGEDCTLRIYR